MTIGARIAAIIESEPDRRLLEWHGQWFTRGHLARFAGDMNAVLDARQIEPGTAVALAGRNRPSHCFATLTLTARGLPVSMLYAFQSAESLARDLTSTRFAVAIIDEQDFAPEVREAANASGTTVIVLRPLPTDGFAVVDPDVPVGKGAYRLPGPGIEILSSGTTGLPKRLFHPAERLFRALYGEMETPDAPPGLVMWPTSGIGGNMQLISAIIKGIGIVLLEKFEAWPLAEAIKRNKINSLGFTPAMLRMFLDADIPPEYLESVPSIVGGAGPIDPDKIDEFERRYGKPILWAMGATEFCGTIIAWDMDSYRQMWAHKRGSSGRAVAGVELRITDPDTGEELPRNSLGRLSAKVEAVGDEWIVTNDLARIDEDGYVFFEGRADGAIMRGGFKIVPEKVCQTLRQHPDVAEAALIGIPDERLGEVPVAVIEPRPGHTPSAEDLAAFARAHLAAPFIPVKWVFVDRLPYTASTKVAVGEVRKLLFARLGIVDPKAKLPA